MTLLTERVKFKVRLLVSIQYFSLQWLWLELKILITYDGVQGYSVLN